MMYSLTDVRCALLTGLWRLAPSSLVPQTFQLARKDASHK
jgi:hypothetical protein